MIRKNIDGFTLIELMIVIAIIGIIASTALPIYIDYTARSQTAEALKMNSGVQSDIATFYAENKAWPTTTTSAGEAIINAAKAISGKYAKNKSTPIGDSGKIQVIFTAGANSSKDLILIPVTNSTTGQIQKWNCTGTVGASRIPSSCQ